MIGSTRSARTALVAILVAFIFAQPGHAQMRTDLAGNWRGEFIIRDSIRAPFQFEIDSTGKVFMLNGEERFETSNIQVTADSMFLPLDQFDNELAFVVTGGEMTGVLRRQDHAGSPTRFIAKKGNLKRFNVAEHSFRNVSGSYDVTFEFESGNKEKAVAIFQQRGEVLTGTFLKPSGDTRFLEGTVAGNRFYLSSFIGSSPGYFEGVISADGRISGFQAGTKVKHKFSGRLNNKAKLADPFSVSLLKKGHSTIDFALPDTSGKMISLKDEKYRGKVVILAITGTWCPNCIDEAAFLSPWYKDNKQRGVEIITIHFERQADTAFTKKVMGRFRKRFNITYDQVFGGMANNESVLNAIKGLETFSSFPTTIFVGTDGKVSKIHSGYSGPATGKFYTDFVEEFNAEVDHLLESSAR